MPTERRFDLTAFFKSYSSEILERFFPPGNPVVKLAILFLSQIGSSWISGPTKLTVHILIAAIWLSVFGQEHYYSFWINYAIFTRLDSLFFRSHPYGCKSGFVLFWVCRCCWKMGLYLSSYICERIWWYPAMVGFKDNPDQSSWQTGPRQCLEPDNWVQGVNRTNIRWLIFCTNSSKSLLFPIYETSQWNWWLLL